MVVAELMRDQPSVLVGGPGERSSPGEVREIVIRVVRRVEEPVFEDADEPGEVLDLQDVALPVRCAVHSGVVFAVALVGGASGGVSIAGSGVRAVLLVDLFIKNRKKICG